MLTLPIALWFREIISIPAQDRFQIITEHAKTDLIYDRTASHHGDTENSQRPRMNFVFIRLDSKLVNINIT